jgi:hypothetical protein
MMQHRLRSQLLLLFCLWSATSSPGLAQGGTPPATLSDLYSSIQAQEANFPLPQTTETITVANIDVSETNSSEPVIAYSIPIYYNGTHPVAKRSQAPCTGNRVVVKPAIVQPMPVIGKGPCESTVQWPNSGGQLTVTNILHLNIVFSISGWRDSKTSLTVTLGSLPPQTVPFGSTQVVFNDVTDTAPQLTVTLNGGLTANGVPIPDTASGVLPLTIKWELIGAGAITIPVLPVSIIYAPVVDAQQKNSAASATGISSSNTTTVTFSSQTSTTVPVDTSFQNVVDITQAMQAIGPVLQKIPNGITQGVGAGLTTIAGLMGSSTATQTNSGVTATQNGLLVGSSQLITQTALASQGGPGVGDLITYYYNARVVWFSDGGTMRLAVLGFDGMVQINAGKLTSAWLGLQSQPPGTVDPVAHLNSDSLHALLLLDPFFDGTPSANPTAQLSGTRFVPVSNGVVEIAGGLLNEQFTHQISSTDIKTQQATQTYSETDKAGLLSFLGIGVTSTQTIQTSLSQGTSSQNTIGKTATQSFTFNSNPNEYYSCEVYFDVVFGAFAFRVVNPAAASSIVKGTVVNSQGKAVPDARVVARVGSRIFITAADASGRFGFRLPGFQKGMIRISATSSGSSKKKQKPGEAQVVTDINSSRDIKLQLY